MRKEPTVIYLFRLLVGLSVFIFMCLLYWSSLLIEQQLIKINEDITALKSAILQKTTRQAHGEPISTPISQRVDRSISPNLLHEDLFYQKTLPQMLGENFTAKGTRYTATIGKPETLHPFSNWSQVVAWVDQCTASLSASEFGKYETMAPDMAIKMELHTDEEGGSPEFWVYLRRDLFWQPLSSDLFSEKILLAPHFLQKHPVTAHDFKFYFDVVMNPYVQEPGAVALRNYIGAIKQIEVIDDFTFIVRWKTENVKGSDGKVVSKMKYSAPLLTGGLKPLASFVYKYFPDGKKIIEDEGNPDIYRTDSVWAQNFSHHWAKNIIISCGPWIFDGMTDRYIHFKRNPDYYNPYAVLVERMEVEFKNTPDNLWQDFKEGKIDTYSLQPNQLIELESFLLSAIYKQQAAHGLAVHQLEYLDRSYSYIGWNEVRPFFKSARVRRALTMAIDRERLIRETLNGLGVQIHGTFFIHSPETNAKIESWPYDPREATRLLETEGWYDRDGSGVIGKEIDGKWIPFRFTLTYYVKNPTTKVICESVATGLKEIGIDCQLNGVDTADLSALFDEKSFDALCLAWALGAPPEDPKQLWHSSGALEKGSSNMIGFSNQEIDQIIGELQFEFDRKKRLSLYHRFDEIIHQEQPYTFLYTPKILFLYRAYVQNVFIPAQRQDLIPGADIEEPQPSIFWLSPHD